MGLTNGALPVNQKHGRGAQFYKVFHLEILPCHPRTFVAQDGVRIAGQVDIIADHKRPIRYHYQDFCIEAAKLFIVMTQLRHMVGAVRSGKTNIEHQQGVFAGDDFR